MKTISAIQKITEVIDGEKHTTGTRVLFTPDKDIDTWCDEHEAAGYTPYVYTDGEEKKTTWDKARQFEWPKPKREER